MCEETPKPLLLQPEALRRLRCLGIPCADQTEPWHHPSGQKGGKEQEVEWHFLAPFHAFCPICSHWRPGHRQSRAVTPLTVPSDPQSMLTSACPHTQRSVSHLSQTPDHLFCLLLNADQINTSQRHKATSPSRNGATCFATRAPGSN